MIYMCVCEKVTAVFAAYAVLLYVDVTGEYQQVVASMWYGLRFRLTQTQRNSVNVYKPQFGTVLRYGLARLGLLGSW